MTISEIEGIQRRMTDTAIEIRSEKENEPSKIVGYALKFNRWSQDFGFGKVSFKERLSERCLEGVDLDKVAILFNHDSNQILGRSGVNATLSVDEIGLRFEVVPTNTSYGNDVLENVRSGILNKCSFAFTIDDDGQEFKKVDDNHYERTINKIERLYDVSVVTSPAYEDTEAVLSERSLSKIAELNIEPKIDIEKQKLALLAEL